MKLVLNLILIFTLSIQLQSQEFLWAKSYEISNCNEVAAVAVDTSGNIFIAGVYDYSGFLPYNGNCYIQKTDGEGEIIWTEYLSGMVQIGDMATVDNSIIIIGQSTGPFSYQNEEYGTASTFMFFMKINELGSIEWHVFDETKFGAYTNVSAGKLGVVALHIRGQYNQGDWIYIINEDGTILNTKELSSTETLVIDMAYYNDWVYINCGFNGQGGIVIDTILIEQPAIEHATFVLALDENLVAKWVSVDTTINNRDGRIAVNSAGIFSYQEVLEPPFNIINSIKKFDFDGTLLAEVELPVFSNAISLYPDMTISSSQLGLFVQNDFNFNSHKVILYDNYLNLESENIINGTSDLYSGQIASNGNDFFVAHVFSGDLMFDETLSLPYTGSGKLPYIAKLGVQTTTNTSEIKNANDELIVYPNPADEKITISLGDSKFKDFDIEIYNQKGEIVLKKFKGNSSKSIDISMLPVGIYILQVIFNDGNVLQKKILKR